MTKGRIEPSICISLLVVESLEYPYDYSDVCDIGWRWSRIMRTDTGTGLGCIRQEINKGYLLCLWMILRLVVR